MTQKRAYKRYPKEFKEEAVALVREQGYTVPQAAEAVGVTTTVCISGKKKSKPNLRVQSYLMMSVTS